MSFLDHLAGVTARLRRGETLPLDELYELKRENRRRAEEAEREDRAVCDSLPTWINTTNSTVCNLKCVFCNQAYGKGVDVKMEEQVYRRVVEELYRRRRSCSSRPTASR
jgi:sulfatase maturation enzyme AslB (radical SAM superfamily)